MTSAADGTAGHRPPDAASAGTPPIDRKQDILAAAALAFATNGYGGASLRDIAGAAGVSLTLLAYHFGGKGELLEAVIERHHRTCRLRLVALRAALLDAHDVPLERLVAGWVRHEFDLHAADGGELYLRLMARLADDAEVGAGVQRTLDCSEQVVLQAFARAVPAAAPACRIRAFRAARAALHVGIQDAAVAAEEGAADAREDAIAFTTRFLAAGVGAALG